MRISDEAVEAALKTWGDWPEGMSPQEQMTRILEAAAPHMYSDWLNTNEGEK